MNYFEANDDAVTVSCAVIPNGIHLATLPYYHDQMINNNRTWKILHSLFLNGYMNGAIISINYSNIITSKDVNLAIVNSASYLIFDFYGKYSIPIVIVILFFLGILYKYLHKK